MQKKYEFISVYEKDVVQFCESYSERDWTLKYIGPSKRNVGNFDLLFERELDINIDFTEEERKLYVKSIVNFLKSNKSE
jgi:hypothetical protein